MKHMYHFIHMKKELSVNIPFELSKLKAITFQLTTKEAYIIDINLIREFRVNSNISLKTNKYD